MKNLLTYCLLLTTLFATAQVDDKPYLGVVVKTSPEKIQLRWFPSNYELFLSGNSEGYNVYRSVVERDGKKISNPKEVKLNKKPLVKLDAKTWEKMADTSEAMLNTIFLSGDLGLAPEQTDVGSQIQDYDSKEMMFALAGIGANQSVQVAKHMGLYFEDLNVNDNERYVYVVRLHKAPVEYHAGRIYASSSDKERVPTPAKIKAIFHEHAVSLQWNKDYGRFVFSHWDIYRSTNSKKGFVKVNDIPFIAVGSSEMRNPNAAYYADSLPSTEETYYYKVQGVSPFGDRSPFSEVVFGKSMHKLREIPRITTVKSVDGNVQLEWEFIEEERQYVDYYSVQRAENPLDEFSVISEPLKELSFSDLEPLRVNYYQVCAYGIDGDVSCSPPHNYTQIDSLPPAAPIVLEGKADTNGVVTFSWKANKEKDMYGYRIYRANAAYEEYRRITPGDIQDTVYSDTINLDLLYKKIYYKIVAIDDHYNPSQLSEALVIDRPDLHPPTSPVISKYKSTINGIVLEWKSSSSKDVVKQVLYRQGPIDANFRPVKEFTSTEVKSFVDNNTEEGSWYKYKVYAFDDYGNQSPELQAVRVQQVMNPIKEPVKNLQGLLSRPHRQIKVYWEEDNKGVDYFTVYRAKGEGPLKRYTAVKGNEREFFDTNLVPDNEYTYVIITEYKNGARSKRSEELKLKY